MANSTISYLWRDRSAPEGFPPTFPHGPPTAVKYDSLQERRFAGSLHGMFGHGMFGRKSFAWIGLSFHLSSGYSGLDGQFLEYRCY